MTGRLFVSSVQKELAAERRAVRDFIHCDALLRRFFDVFLFEDLPASDCRTDDVYLEEVARSGIYLGLFGDGYGSTDEAGLSPTEGEFDEATRCSKVRLSFVRGADDARRDPRMLALAASLIERTDLDNPTSQRQRYRLTKKGRSWLATREL
jgi:ATP-dependent DNA helicase RecG